jgi:hypothetical protein
MNLEIDDKTRVQAMFGLLAGLDPSTFPAAMSLSRALEGVASPDAAPVPVGAAVAKLFATASVDMWLRAVHSFLISISLTDSSPIWSSVAGYYSSHYAIRALSHILGTYVWFSRKRIVRLQSDGPDFLCSFVKKNAGDREHKTYWKIVKDKTPFNANPIFAYNNPEPPSDVSHRDRANYADHLHAQYLKFEPIDKDETQLRIRQISKAALTAPPIPERDNFPDLDSVHIVAYHRIVRYRQTLDETLDESYKFWWENRTPSFADGFMDFQLVEPDFSGELS